jgi:hypothetical protein
LLKSSTFEANSARLEHVGSARQLSQSSDFREKRLARLKQAAKGHNHESFFGNDRKAAP